MSNLQKSDGDGGALSRPAMQRKMGRGWIIGVVALPL